MPTKYVAPSISERAFNCPHCDAFTTQHWFQLYAKRIDNESRTPPQFDPTAKDRIQAMKDIAPENKARLITYLEKFASGKAFFETTLDRLYAYFHLHNAYVSQCYNCEEIAVWVQNRLIHPPIKIGAPPNPDLPQALAMDYEEARAIVTISPRGAAALLRLVIQRLCTHLGERGKNLDDDIASLVSKGLNPLVQKSLDIVRVVGNESVHPGELDLRDDQATATKLFELVNAIADQMITHPQNVQRMFESLPEGKRQAIAKRDEKVER